MADFWTTEYWNDLPTQNYKSDSHNLPSWDKDAFWAYAGNYKNGYERWDETYVWIPNIVREIPLTTLFCAGPSGSVEYALTQRREITKGTAETNTYQTEAHNEVAITVESGFDFFAASASVQSELRSSVMEMSSNAVENNWSNTYAVEETYVVSTECSGWETVQISGLQIKMHAYRKKQGYRRKSSGVSSWEEPFLDYDFLCARWAEGQLFKISYLGQNNSVTISDMIEDSRYSIRKVL